MCRRSSCSVLILSFSNFWIPSRCVMLLLCCTWLAYPPGSYCPPAMPRAARKKSRKKKKIRERSNKTLVNLQCWKILQIAIKLANYWASSSTYFFLLIIFPLLTCSFSLELASTLVPLATLSHNVPHSIAVHVNLKQFAFEPSLAHSLAKLISSCIFFLTSHNAFKCINRYLLCSSSYISFYRLQEGWATSTSAWNNFYVSM